MIAGLGVKRTGRVERRRGEAERSKWRGWRFDRRRYAGRRARWLARARAFRSTPTRYLDLVAERSEAPGETLTCTNRGLAWVNPGPTWPRCN